MVTYHRDYAHHVPTTYTRIRPDAGCGYILSRLYSDGPLTRKQIFKGSKYDGCGRGHLSLLFTALLEDGLIECSNGEFKEYRLPITGWRLRQKTAYRVVAENGVPEYSLTKKGVRLVESLDNFVKVPPKVKVPKF